MAGKTDKIGDRLKKYLSLSCDSEMTEETLSQAKAAGVKRGATFVWRTHLHRQ